MTALIPIALMSVGVFVVLWGAYKIGYGMGQVDVHLERMRESIERAGE